MNFLESLSDNRPTNEAFHMPQRAANHQQGIQEARKTTLTSHYNKIHDCNAVRLSMVLVNQIMNDPHGSCTHKKDHHLGAVMLIKVSVLDWRFALVARAEKVYDDKRGQQHGQKKNELEIVMIPIHI